MLLDISNAALSQESEQYLHLYMISEEHDFDHDFLKYLSHDEYGRRLRPSPLGSAVRVRGSQDGPGFWMATGGEKISMSIS